MKRFFRIRDYEPDAERDMCEELRSHHELMVEDLMSRGMTEEEARARAGELLADPKRARALAVSRAEAIAHTRARLRRRSLLDRLEDLGRDVRYALRRMANSPVFTLVAIGSLAIGIGANTAVFGVVNAFLIRKAPYRDPAELVRVYSTVPGRSSYQTTSYPDFHDMQKMEGVFSGVGAWENTIAVAQGGDEPLRIMAQAVSADLLPMLGVKPVLGRNFFSWEDGAPGAHRVAILGHAFWRRAFGEDRGILGQTLRISGLPFAVVGVAPPWFHSLDFDGLNADVFIPLAMSAAVDGSSAEVYQDRGSSRLEVMARLSPGVEATNVMSRLDVLAAHLADAYPESNQGRTYRLLPATDVVGSPELVRPMRVAAAFLLVVVGMVLLLACVNLASLLLARGIDRRREIAMRRALGAGRWGLVRQLLVEALLLASLGLLAGLGVAHVTTSFLTTYQPPLPIRLSPDLAMDHTVLLFAVGISIFAGVLFGLAPALQGTRLDPAPILKGEGVSRSRKRFTLQSALVALQMAVAVILLVGGGLFARSLLAARKLDPGFSTAPAGIAWIDLRPSRLSGAEEQALRADLKGRVLASPGIQAVAFGSRLPLSQGGNHGRFRIPGEDWPGGEQGRRIAEASVSDEFFEVLGIPVLAGRTFGPGDRAGSPAVAVVNQEMATEFWPGEDPLGKEITSSAQSPPITVVGVVGNTKVNRLGEAPTPLVYLPSDQVWAGDLQIVVRGALPGGELAGVLRRAIREADSDLVVVEIETMQGLLAPHLFWPRAAALLLGSFGVLALLLSGIGLYGIVSLSVSRRIREMGIRISLGATSWTVVRMVVGWAMGAVAVGGFAGLAAAFLLARLIRTFLVGVPPSDPLTLIAIPLLFGTVACFAAFVPARRVGRVDPVRSLRAE